MSIDGTSLSASKKHITANILTKEDASVRLALRLIGYNDGVIRLQVDESPEVNRYRIKDVLLAGQEAREAQLKIDKKSHTKATIALTGTDISLELFFSPIRLHVKKANVLVTTFNADKGFIFQHRRKERKDEDPEGWWAENFKTHHDSKLRGPEAIAFDINFPNTKHVYGLPERAISHALPPTIASNGTALTEPYRLYNLDVFEYLSNSPFGLYGSIPFLIGHRKGQSVGVFWLNAAEMYVDVKDHASDTPTHWLAESGILDLFILPGPLPADVSTQFARLTGGTALPQLFSLGYHQCRWNYRDEADVAQVDAGFDAHTIPYDVIWLDIEHTNGKRYFTWDETLFPTPIRMQDDIASRGRKMVTIVDPHIKRDTQWDVFKDADSKDLFVKNKDGQPFDGWCWPGSSSYLDVTDGRVRDWWADRFSLANYKGSTNNLYIWNDMNEPSVFNGPEITMQKDNLHMNGAEHRDVHNLYGFYYHMATSEGLRRRGHQSWGADGDRPFVLSRAFYAGSQRIGAIWTGDNEASWEQLEVSVPMLLSANIAGMSFSGADVGGFFGNPEVDLLVRWYQSAALTPFFRGHAHLEAKRREPWLFGEEATDRIRAAVQMRYRLLPYLYTVFFHANTTGLPIMRPLWYEFPQAVDQFANDKAFMLGSALLSVPVLKKDQETISLPTIPSEIWYEMEKTGKRVDTLHNVPVTMDSMPLYLKGGSILTMKERPRRSTAAQRSDPFTLYVALDRNTRAFGDVYVDDGRSYAFKNRGQYIYRTFTFEKNTLFSEMPRHEVVGLPPSQARNDEGLTVDRVVILGLDSSLKYVTIKNGVSQEVIQATPGPLYAGKSGQDCIVLRKVGLPIHEDWSLVFTSKNPAVSTS